MFSGEREIFDYLTDILVECDYLIESTRDLTFADFLRNEHLKRAFTRSLEVIGEASKKTLRRYGIDSPMSLGERWPVCGIFSLTSTSESTTPSYGKW